MNSIYEALASEYGWVTLADLPPLVTTEDAR